ncbi:hypothetical protein Deba_3297 [Desulfarculus baarsii DSM 2075]|uniref:Uncharacterized protein n=1 Tax=Desulfarculus baarsii (strain ATCC 33931 / DSM 2075 / LMG 7858 / VKM B-1802 / 2st14) TaxID=644282 RepID=E1QM65_DESB2|nr:hypothetical protein [Desulfarculus baarsii]ADK86650.1 hypothetical protein Deba_3297 [Desulfarculus baarsii DSM 2075]
MSAGRIGGLGRGGWLAARPSRAKRDRSHDAPPLGPLADDEPQPRILPGYQPPGQAPAQLTPRGFFLDRYVY